MTSLHNDILFIIREKLIDLKLDLCKGKDYIKLMSGLIDYCKLSEALSLPYLKSDLKILKSIVGDETIDSLEYKGYRFSNDFLEFFQDIFDWSLIYCFEWQNIDKDLLSRISLEKFCIGNFLEFTHE